MRAHQSGPRTDRNTPLFQIQEIFGLVSDCYIVNFILIPFHTVYHDTVKMVIILRPGNPG